MALIRGTATHLKSWTCAPRHTRALTASFLPSSSFIHHIIWQFITSIQLYTTSFGSLSQLYNYTVHHLAVYHLYTIINRIFWHFLDLYNHTIHFLAVYHICTIITTSFSSLLHLYNYTSHHFAVYHIQIIIYHIIWPLQT